MKKRMLKLTQMAGGWVKLAVGLATLLGLLWGGMVGMNAYFSLEYAKAADLRQHKEQVGKEFSETKVLILKQDIRALRQEKYMFEDAMARRQLMPNEAQRLRQIIEDLNDLEATVKSLGTK